MIIKGSDKPTMKQLNYHVRDQVAVDWYGLGVQLSLDVNQLDIIKTNHSTNVEACCSAMFKHWLEVDTTASWIKLIAVLKRVKKYQLAESISKMFCQGNIHTLCISLNDCKVCIIMKIYSRKMYVVFI